MVSKILDDLLLRSTSKYFEKFSNIHKGEVCYIFGDGPSIKWFELSEFNDYPSICCGLIPFHKDFEKLNVKYISSVGAWKFVPKILQPKTQLKLRSITNEYRKIIEKNKDIEFFVHISNYFSLMGSNINYVYKTFPVVRNKTDELLINTNLFGGAFHSSLAIAYLLGFTKIYLVGFDAWTIQPARSLRWYELGEGEFFEATNFATDFLEILGKNIDIYTISSDGTSKNVKNISYQDYTGKKPEFRENFELIERHLLDVIDTALELKIY